MKTWSCFAFWLKLLLVQSRILVISCLLARRVVGNIHIFTGGMHELLLTECPLAFTFPPSKAALYNNKRDFWVLETEPSLASFNFAWLFLLFPNSFVTWESQLKLHLYLYCSTVVCGCNFSAMQNENSKGQKLHHMLLLYSVMKFGLK